jgi:hypothetical protein
MNGGDDPFGMTTSDIHTVRRGGCSMRICGERRSARTKLRASNCPSSPQPNHWGGDALSPYTCSSGWAEGWSSKQSDAGELVELLPMLGDIVLKSEWYPSPTSVSYMEE